jgi:hypothetical protein
MLGAATGRLSLRFILPSLSRRWKHCARTSPQLMHHLMYGSQTLRSTEAPARSLKLPTSFPWPLYPDPQHRYADHTELFNSNLLGTGRSEALYCHYAIAPSYGSAGVQHRATRN